MLPGQAGREVSDETRVAGRNVSPPSIEAETKTSYALSAAEPRVSSHMTPTTPESFTAMAGKNCDAEAGAETSTVVGALHVTPASDDHTTAIRGVPRVHRMSGNAA